MTKQRAGDDVSHSESINSASPLRILHTESSQGLGGQEYRTLHECLGMKARGHQVYLAVQPSGALFHKAQSAGLHVFPVRMTTVRWVKLIFTFLDLIKRFDIHIVNTHGSIDSWTGGIAARLAPTRPLLVRTRHKSTPVSRTVRHTILYRYLPHTVITTGKRIRETLISENGLREDRVVSIPTGVDLTSFYPREADLSFKRTLGIPLGHFVVGTVAFLRDYKGVEDFLSAAKIVLDGRDNVHFVIVGDGPEKSSLQETAQRFDIEKRVLFLGFREDVQDLLALFHVVVLSSIAAEGVPQALSQALAMKRAVIATNVGGIPEVIRHGETGLLVPPARPQELADKIAQVLDQVALRKKLGQTGQQIVVQKYSLDEMLNQTERLYEYLRTGAAEE